MFIYTLVRHLCAVLQIHTFPGGNYIYVAKANMMLYTMRTNGFYINSKIIKICNISNIGNHSWYIWLKYHSLKYQYN